MSAIHLWSGGIGIHTDVVLFQGRNKFLIYAFHHLIRNVGYQRDRIETGNSLRVGFSTIFGTSDNSAFPIIRFDIGIKELWLLRRRIFLNGGVLEGVLFPLGSKEESTANRLTRWVVLCLEEEIVFMFSEIGNGRVSIEISLLPNRQNLLVATGTMYYFTDCLYLDLASTIIDLLRVLPLLYTDFVCSFRFLNYC